MKRIFAILLFCCTILSTQAQKIGEWHVYPSYWIATQNVTAGSCVYGLMNGNLLRYDTDDTSVKLYDCLEDLSDVHITHIAYSKEAKRLILVYQNGNIDLMDLEDNVENIASLRDSRLTKKEVSAVGIDGSTAYLITGFGYVTIDMKEGVIRNTYTDGQKPQGVDTKPSEYNLAGGLYWHSDGIYGLRGYKQSGNQYTLATGSIQPNSPVRDLFYRMQYVGDRLLVSGGINSPYAIYNPATAMYYQDGKWTNFDEVTPAEKYPKIHHWNTTNLVQDPQDSTHHFASPYRTGLYEYRNGKFVGLYNCDNSPLEQIRNLGVNYVGCCGLQYDNEGNLWLMNQQTDTIVRIIKGGNPSKRSNWISLYYPEIEGTETCEDYLFSSSGVNFLTSRRVGGRGFFGFYTNGTLSNVRDDKHILRQTLVNQDGTSYSPDQFYCMTEDMDGRIWCGTQLGLFVINDPTTYFDNDFRFEQVKIARNDGSGLADYLLNGVSISCIAVDGANRKWIGTHNDGLYLVSADGTEMLQHFQADDSPLLDNYVTSIAIHPTTGLVMIGTDSGLCSYMADATEAEETLDKDNVLAYPNPVRPDYTGPITVDGLSMDSEVKICSSTGQLVWSGHSNGGRFTWDGCNKQGRRVASGVYNVVASNASGKKAIVTRIIVIR